MTLAQTSFSISDVIRGSEYALTIFSDKERGSLAIYGKNGRPYLTCVVTGKARPAKPEEVVRQLFLLKLLDEYGYPKDRIALEKPVYFGSTVHTKAADIVVYEEDLQAPYIIVEVKKPKRKDGLEQLKSYCNAEGSPIGVWTNGSELLALHREEPNVFRNLPNIPRATQTLSEMLDTPWTLQDLEKHNRLVVERTSLKDVILDMEDLVLANAGVDAFDEVFKLIYAKLFDEWNAARGRANSHTLQFRVGRRTAREFSLVVEDLLDRAMATWPGVFDEGARIELEPEHLLVCGSFLEDVKLFNSNLQVIDEAFEYLVVQAAKGEKGQYFTPRHVIDMCVEMLSPTIDDYVIDTAAGSCGFTVHSIFHVWGNEFTASGPTKWQSEYASTHVYAIDFDKRATRIARALNLIAGDGRTNVYRANALDPRSWNDEVKVALRSRLRQFGQDPARARWNRDHYRFFDFDVLLTNPPFAGDIKERRLLSQYSLAQNKGKLQAGVGRDVLFIERNLEFLRPGGRAAMILPQGRLNNSSDVDVRRWITEHARILAVVGLHPNTFRPHTGTKTSVLFLQTWNEDESAGPLNPRLDDYPVFFATSERPGKDNGGNYIHKVGADNAPLLDEHGHLIIDHDLDEIASAFRQWASKQRLSFARRH